MGMLLSSSLLMLLDGWVLNVEGENKERWKVTGERESEIGCRQGKEPRESVFFG